MQENTYFMNPEDAAEMARLSLQDLLLTKANGDLFPVPIPEKSRVIDLGCGPGGWLLALGDTYRAQGVTGIGVDVDQMMITYAHGRAESLDLDNLLFEQMDLRKRAVAVSR